MKNSSTFYFSRVKKEFWYSSISEHAEVVLPKHEIDKFLSKFDFGEGKTRDYKKEFLNREIQFQYSPDKGDTLEQLLALYEHFYDHKMLQPVFHKYYSNGMRDNYFFTAITSHLHWEALDEKINDYEVIPMSTLVEALISDVKTTKITEESLSSVNIVDPNDKVDSVELLTINNRKKLLIK